jgi:hypothetical protein
MDLEIVLYKWGAKILKLEGVLFENLNLLHRNDYWN